MALKVLICDDELLICELLQRLIPWEELGFEIIDIVYNGKDALEKIYAKKPDVVITDVRMPDIDGLELVKIVSDKQLPIKFIMISGHRQFEYAYTAIKYNVEDYLLKPIKGQELCAILLKIKSLYEKNAEAKQKLEISRNVIHEKLLESILSCQKLSNSFTEINRQYGFHFQPGIFFVAVVDFDYLSSLHEISEQQKKYIHEKTITRIIDILLEECFDYAYITKGSQTVLLLNIQPENSRFSNLKNKLLQALSHQNMILDFADVYKTTLCFGQAVYTPEMLSTSWETAKYLSESRMLLGCGGYLEYKQQPHSDINPEKLFPLSQWEKLATIIQHLDIVEFQSWIHSLIDEVKSASKMDTAISYKTGQYFIQKFNFYCQKYDYQIPVSLSEKLIPPNLPMYQFRMYWNTIENTVTDIFTLLTQSSTNTVSMAVQKAKYYIAEHLADTISLDSVAEIVNLNPAYFSFLFKKETGKNFLEYLTECRMSKAKSLLSDTNLPITEIANQAGYYDTKYFSKLFKKSCHISPKQYRQLYWRN